MDLAPAFHLSGSSDRDKRRPDDLLGFPLPRHLNSFSFWHHLNVRRQASSEWKRPEPLINLQQRDFLYYNLLKTRWTLWASFQGIRDPWINWSCYPFTMHSSCITITIIFHLPLYFWTVASVHSYNAQLASKSTYYINAIKTNYGKFNIRFAAVKVWNHLDENY